MLFLNPEHELLIEVVWVGVDGLIEPWYSARCGNDYFEPSGDTSYMLISISAACSLISEISPFLQSGGGLSYRC